jgi:hypothetical protein
VAKVYEKMDAKRPGNGQHRPKETRRWRFAANPPTTWKGCFSSPEWAQIVAQPYTYKTAGWHIAQPLAKKNKDKAEAAFQAGVTSTKVRSMRPSRAWHWK